MNKMAQQQVAIGREKDAALRVIMPRVMGALRHQGKVVWHEGIQVIEVMKRNFLIRLTPEAHSVYFSISHRAYRHVLSGRLYSDGSGNWLDGRLYILGWDRSAEHREWQAELFETFTADSEWLLSIPQKVVRPEIVTAVLLLYRAPKGVCVGNSKLGKDLACKGDGGVKARMCWKRARPA